MQRSVAEAKAIQAQLLATQVESMDVAVPSTIQRQIQAMKEALATTVDAYMRCKAKSEINPKQLQNDLAALFEANVPEKPEEPYRPGNTSMVEDQVYGANLKIAATRPVKEPQLIAIELSFGIECGDDTLLLIYERDKNIWRRSLRWNSDGYSQISGAFGDFFQYAVMPYGSSGRWVVAVTHGHPWCTSRWSGLDLDVLEPDHGTASQHVLFHKQYGYVREADPVMKIKPDGLELRFEKGCLDLGILTRPGIYRYQMADNQMHRVQPVAMNGRDFVDEWLQTEWSDAAHWSAGNLKNLESEHARFVQLSKAEKPLLSYGPVRGCSGDARLFSVELDLDPGDPSYFLIQQGENSFTLRQVSSTSFPNCHGPNLMPVQ